MMTEEKSKKMRQILAWMGLLIILAIIVLFIIVAFLDIPNKTSLMGLCVFGMVGVPFVIYVILMFARLNKNNVINIENKITDETGEEKK